MYMLILPKLYTCLSLESLAFHVNFYGLICVWDMYVYL